jgi:iron complex outermembrane receptor protein
MSASRQTTLSNGSAKSIPVCAVLILVTTGAAFGQEVEPGERITVLGHTANDAVAQAPSQTPLNATQPTSIISSQFIQNSIPPQSDYSQVVSLSPSTYAINQNGPGGAFAASVSIRGFQDGQYNVTLDGIPFGDSNNYTHHSSSYFVNRDLADVEVDRGPGTASTIGNATFGGTISLVTKDPAKDATFTPFASGGSFGTVLYGAQLDTGALPGGGSAVIDGEGTSTDGAETHANAQRQNIFAKFTQPVGDTTTLTIEGMYNASDIAFWRGASRAQIAAFGSDYAFTDIPGTDDYYKYWTTDTHADFEYARLQSKLSDHWSLDTSVYTYAYSNDAHRPIDGTGSTVGTIYGATDIPGITQINEYRAFGDVLRLTRAFSLAGMTGDLKFGGWVEHQENAYTQANVDVSLNYKLTPETLGAFAYLDHEDLLTVQPYVELDLEPLPGLVITPGLKYDFFNRSLDAAVNSGGGSLDYARDYGAILPAVTAHYMIRSDWSTYVQYAKGFQMPNLNYIQVADPTQTSVSPQKTDNYQIGTTWQNHRLSLSADLYYIDFGNMVASRNVGVNTIYFNQGRVDYYGVEVEGTLNIGWGVNLYANASGNEARARTTDKPVANSPQATAAAGIIYANQRFSASLIDKWVGTRYGDVNLGQGLDPFNQLDLSATTFLHVRGNRKWKLSVQLDNLLDSRKIIAFDGYVGAANTPLFFTQPGRSVFASVELPL